MEVLNIEIGSFWVNHFDKYLVVQTLGIRATGDVCNGKQASDGCYANHKELSPYSSNLFDRSISQSQPLSMGLSETGSLRALFF